MATYTWYRANVPVTAENLAKKYGISRDDCDGTPISLLRWISPVWTSGGLSC